MEEEVRYGRVLVNAFPGKKGMDDMTNGERGIIQYDDLVVEDRQFIVRCDQEYAVGEQQQGSAGNKKTIGYACVCLGPQRRRPGLPQGVAAF